MPRNTPAVLAALLCLLVGPALFAARPTRPVRPSSRLASGEPHLRLARTRATRSHGSAARRGQTSPSHSRSALRTQTDERGTATPRISARRSKRLHATQDDSSFLARSARAAEQRRAQREQSNVVQRPDVADLQIDPVDAEADLLPASRSFSLYDQRGRLILPAPLRGSREVLLHQNQMADDEGLARIQDDADLDQLRSTRQLVPLPTSEALRVDERLPEDRRYSRPWTAVFLAALARDYYARFHMPLQVDSAVRTVDVQKRLERTNGNAAPAEGETASPHLTGQAVDIAKRGLTLAEIAWLRLYLQPLMDTGSIDVEEEFRQACFHISVYKSYLPLAPPHVSVAAAAERPDAQP